MRHGLAVPIASPLWPGLLLAMAGIGLTMGSDPMPMLVAKIVALVVLSVALVGLFMVQPNQGVVLQLFGRYVGTARDNGLRWANPFYSKKPVTLRVRNFESSKLKVNDLEGSPIEIGAVVVTKIEKKSATTRRVVLGFAG